MKYLKKYKLFESSYDDMKYIVEDLKDLSLEFDDNECQVRMEPSNDIHVKILGLRLAGKFSGTSPFYIEIGVNPRIIVLEVERKKGKIYKSLPDWFIENCRRIEEYMLLNGFKTIPSIRYAIDWEYLDSIDDLSQQEALIYKVKLEFTKL